MIFNKIFSFFTLLLLFLNTNIFANVININEKTFKIDILDKSYLFIDENSTKTLSQISRENAKFIPILDKYINYGYKFKDTFWIRFSVKNTSNKDILKYLVFDSPNIDIINLHLQKDNNKYLFEDGIFNRTSFNSELSFSFPLAIKAYEIRTYYLEVKPITHSLHFSLKIKDYKTFKNDELHHQLILTIFFGILFVIMIYNTIIYISSKDTIYIYYSFFILTLFIHHLHIRGMLAYFLPSNSQIFAILAYMPIYNLAIVLVAMFLFVKKFLNLQRYKKLYFGLQLFIVVIVLILIFHSSENYILNYLTPLALLFALYVEFIGFYLFIKTNEKNATYFFIIWSISLGGMIGTMLYYVGILPSAIPYLFEMTVIIEVLLFSIVLANQIKDLQKEKLEKNKIVLEQTKLASMGELLQNISHQWRQPLSEINSTAMKIDADFYKKRLDASTLEIYIQQIENLTEYMSNTIESFNSYFKHNRQLEITTLELAVTKALTLSASLLKDINVKFSVEENSTLNINLSELLQVILIILNNAVDALVSNNIQNKIITIKIKKIDNKSILEIEDNAGGVKEENIRKIFEPYFTTKFKADGIGIGLYMAKILTESNLKGELSVQNTANGARFKIIL